jgi:8-oxo-dGTP diphosphatase
MTAPVVVVAAALFDRGRLLAARRSAPPGLAGRWELPGGKVEAGETPQQALVRELREELGIEARPLARIPGEWPLKPGYVLQAWTARLVTGEPRPLQDHDDLRWLGPGETWDVPWLDQDVPAVREAVACPADTADVMDATDAAGATSRACGACPVDAADVTDKTNEADATRAAYADAACAEDDAECTGDTERDIRGI